MSIVRETSSRVFFGITLSGRNANFEKVYELLLDSARERFYQNYLSSAARIASISTEADFGKELTSMVARAGYGFLK